MTQLIFGIDRLPQSTSTSINPCVDVYGKGPEGKKCKDCIHLYAKQYSKRYYKCELRKNTNGPRTDHRVYWPACGKHEEEWVQ